MAEHHVAYRQWRLWLEEGGLFIFDVPLAEAEETGHACHRPPVQTQSIDRGLDMNGCTACGRAHACRSDPRTCLAVAHPSDSGGTSEYTCVFSSHVVAAPPFAVGIYEREQELRHEDEGLGGQGYGHHVAASSRRSANFVGDTKKRAAAFRLDDNSRRLQATAIKVMARGKKRKREEGKKPKHRVKNKKKAQQEPEMPDGTRATRDEGWGGGDMYAFSPLAKEEARDAAWSLEQVAPVMPWFALYAHAFAPDATAPLPSQAQTQAPPPQAPPGTRPKKGLPRVTEAQTREIEACVRTAAALMAKKSKGDVAPASAAQLGRYTQLAVRVALLLRQSLKTHRDVELFVGTLLLDVLADDFVTTDAFGARMLIWTADPWLASCLVHNKLRERLKRPSRRTRREPMRDILVEVLYNMSHKSNVITSALLALRLPVWTLVQALTPL